jgi:hypothetical protein
MKSLALTLTFAALTAIPAWADTKVFRDIIGDAANIQIDAETLRDGLKAKTLDADAIKAEVAALDKHVEQLQKDVDALDAHLLDLTPNQKKDWELAKTKVQLLNIFSDWKVALVEAGDLRKNRNLLGTYAHGIAVRAQLLKRTVNRLDR